MSEIVTFSKETLPMQLDSVSWNKKYDLLAVGAYMINPSNSEERVGKIFLIQLIIQDDQITSSEILQEVDTSGVLDLRWNPYTEKTLAVATSTSLALYELVEEGNNHELRLKDNLELTVMALYTQWTEANSLVFSDSDGCVSVATIDPLKLKSYKKLHDNLTWVVQYSSKNNLMFAGSDEGKFTGFLLENIEDEEKHYTKKFEVGVTSIIFFGENFLAVGSYDETLRVFSIDCLNPILLSLKKKIEFGGALWRTLSFPADDTSDSTETTKKFYIIAACARNGIHVVHVNCETWSYETCSSCLEFEGFLAYGIDVKVKKCAETSTFLVASCYFDNQQLHLWKTTIKNLE